MSTPTADHAGLPHSTAVPIVTYGPVLLSVPGRPTPLAVKVSAPATGAQLPVIVFSHGHGASNFLASSRGYGPLTEFWAAHGFVVVQPLHLDFPGYGLREDVQAGVPLLWRSRVEDMKHVLDHLSDIESAVPGLLGRVDASKVAALGHSLGGHAVAMLLGATLQDTDRETVTDLRDDRISAGVIMAGPGAGDGLTAAATQRFPDLAGTTFATMTQQALVVVGEGDYNPVFSERRDWRADAHTRSPRAATTLLTVLGGQHMLGGVSGYDAESARRPRSYQS